MLDYGNSHAISEIITQADVSIKKLVWSRFFSFFFLLGAVDFYGPKQKKKTRSVPISRNMIRIVYTDKNVRYELLSSSVPNVSVVLMGL